MRLSFCHTQLKRSLNKSERLTWTAKTRSEAAGAGGQRARDSDRVPARGPWELCAALPRLCPETLWWELEISGAGAFAGGKVVNSAHPRFLSPPSPQRLVAEHRPALLLTDTWKGQTHTGPASRRPVRSLGAPRSLCPPVPEGQVRSWPCSGCLGHADGWQPPCKPGKGQGAPLSRTSQRFSPR